MARFLYIIFIILNLGFVNDAIAQEQRFPKPDFETGYVQPNTSTPEPRSLSLEYFDVGILLIVLILAAYFALKSRSRKGILWLSVFSLLYFGFYREGCICSIGSIQNMALSFFDGGYSISLTVIAFFAIPLLFTLFFGRVFCASACPLGVIQDLLIFKPITLPKWLQNVLGVFPYVYLGLSVLYAATGADFIICRYDPFVGIFRMGAEFHMVVLGISFVLIGLFVARPYCRFVCPYGVLLNWMSRLSNKHLTITPSKCVQCNLCENSCPFDAINKPTDTKDTPDTKKNIKLFIVYALMIPFWAAMVGYATSEAHVFLSKAHPDVYLAELLIENPDLLHDTENIDIKAFMESERTLDELIEDVEIIKHEFYIGSWILGIFIGLVIGIKLMQMFRFKKQIDFEPDKGECFSCARCIDYCPVEK